VASEPHREVILQACEARLLAINGTGAYHHVMATVRRGKYNPAALGTLPAAFLQEGEEETHDEEIAGLILRTLHIFVDVWMECPAEEKPSTVANRMLADLERAFTADATLGGLVNNVSMTDNEVATDEPPGILAAVSAQFKIQYQTLRGDPSTQG
jgi:hypothetical protein